MLSKGHSFKLLTEEVKVLVPLPMSYNFDKLEQADLTGVIHWQSEHPDVNSLVHITDLGHASVTLPARNEQNMAEVSHLLPFLSSTKLALLCTAHMVNRLIGWAEQGHLA